MQIKIKKIQIIRHLVQIASIFLLPGLYVLSFDELKTLYTMISSGNFNLISVFPNLVELTTVILATIILGRFFCGWICTFGSYNDLVHFISKNIFKVKFKINPKVDAVLKYTKYLILVLIATISWTFGSTILEGTSPWDAFAQITDISNVISSLAIGLILLILITIGAFFIERFFCRYLCPLGAIFTLVSKISIFKFNKPNDKCGKCMACTSNCSMGLPLYEINSVRGGECINCFNCLEICPRKNTKANLVNQDVNPALASSIAIAGFVGIYALNNVAGTALTKTGLASTSSISSTSSASSNYTDGTYTGSASGFKNGTTKVSVTIKNSQITNIETVSNGDTPNYYSKVESKIFNEIIQAQSTSVDTVSGATFSSKGIINAVKTALSTAKSTSQASNSSSTEVNSDNKTTSTTTTATTENNNTTTNSTASSSTTTTDNNTTSSNQSQYKDGTYSGSATGFKRGTTKLSVTISSGKITNIETLSNGDTPKYYDRVESTMFNKILSSQSTSVDTVSGATFSCRGIINAVKSALEQAV